MPVLRSNYPKGWPAISLRKREEAGWKCQECGAPEGAEIVRTPGNTKQWILYDGGELFGRRKAIKVRLGVAHRDQNTMNCNDENLAVWCQCCHLNFDRPFNNEKKRRKKEIIYAVALGQLSLRLT